MRPQRSFVRGMQQYRRGLALTWLGPALLVLFTARPVLAHGGGVPQLTNAEAGPYRVSAWTQPDPIRMGDFHITVAVMHLPESSTTHRETGDLVLDATVLVHLEPLDQAGETLLASASRDNAVNKLYYEADLALPSEGGWRVGIEVAGSAGAGWASFDIQALPPTPLSSLQRLPGVAWGGLALALLAAGWWVQAFRARSTEAHHA